MTALDDKQLSSALNQLEQDFIPYVEQMEVRRRLIERYRGAVNGAGVGTTIPRPYDKSELIIKHLDGRIVEGVQHYAARIAANAPQPVVPRVANTRRVAKNIEEKAAEQERLLSALWVSSRGPSRQYEIAWSQSWCRVGWYLTLPADASWGLPDRSYWSDLDDETLARMRSDEYLSPEPDDAGRWMESGGSWIKRRRVAAQQNAIDARPLFTLEAIPGDMMRWRFDLRGLKYACSIAETPASDFGPGSDMMMDIARRNGLSEAEVGQFGIIVQNGKITMGVTAGGELDSTQASAQSTFNFIRFADRECIYYLVASVGQVSSAKLIWSAPHGAGRVPFVPAPANRTDSRRPGNEYSCPMEQVFAIAPHVNQLYTLASNIAVNNGIPRWVTEVDESGAILMDEKGDPKMTVAADLVGGDPAESQVIAGKLRQVVIDGSFVERQVDRLDALIDKAMPPDVTRGEGGTSGAAWAIRQLLSAAQADLEQPVSNHALAVKEIFEIWVRWLRLLDVSVYALSVPRSRGNMRAVRGLIEMDPADLVEGFEVVQSKDSASDRIVLQQHGNELLKAGLIDMRRYLEEYALEPDPTQAEKDLLKQKVKDIVLGVGPPAPPDTVLAQVVQAVHGRLFLAMMERSSNAVILQAELLAKQAQLSNPAQQGMTVSETPTNMQPESGNIAEANGMRQPGLGSSISLPGSPDMGINAMNGRAQ